MSLKLNTDGLIPSKKNGNNKQSSSRHKTARKSIALNFSNTNKQHATGLAYWQKHKLATPLIWFLLDSLAKQENGANGLMGVADVVSSVPAECYAEKLLLELRSQK